MCPFSCSLAFTEVVIAPSNSTADEGSTVLAVCVGNGNPLPGISWSREGTILTNGSLSDRVSVWQETVEEDGVLFVQSVLQLCSLDGSDTGEYTCTVANDQVADSISFSVTVEQEVLGEIIVFVLEYVNGYYPSPY